MNCGIHDKHMGFNLSEMGAEEDLSAACYFHILKAWHCFAVHYRAAKRSALQSVRQVGIMCMKSKCYCEFFYLGYFEQRAPVD